MSIKQTQYELIRDQIIQRELQKGEFPSLSLIEFLVLERFGEKITGEPRFHFRPAEKGQTSNSQAYNAMLSEIHEDLTVGFEETKLLNNQIMALSTYYESNRIRVEQELRAVELKAQNLATRAVSHVNRDVVGDSLTDFSQLEFMEDVRRNIPKTNAYIDLRHGEASLNRIPNSTVKHNISGARATFVSLTPETRVVHLTPLSHALQDKIHDSWRSLIIDNKADGIQAQLQIELEEAVSVTQISLDMQSAKPVVVTLFVSEDGEHYTELETRKITSVYNWMFERTRVKFVRLLLEKKEEDRANGMEYEYIFGAKQIEVKDDVFLLSNYLVSKPFPIHYHDAIDYIHLEAEDYMPPDTLIRYYVGLDYETNLIEWQEIQKDRPVEMRMVQEHRLNINPLEIDQYTEGYGEPMYVNFGQSFYAIAKLDRKPLAKSIQIQMGRNMWMKETILAPFTYEPVLDEKGHEIFQPVYITGVKDWIRSASPKKKYMNIDSYQDTLESGTFQRYTTYVYVNPDSPKMTLDGVIEVGIDASFSLYMNNNKVKNADGKYTFAFRPGWNKIEVYTYSRKSGQEIILNFYLREISDRIYAHYQPIQEVSLYDLLNNTSNRVHDRFALDEKNNIIVNYNPRELDIMKNGVEYTLAYRYSVSSHTKHQLRFMAILSKAQENVSVSPRLKEYKLVIE